MTNNQYIEKLYKNEKILHSFCMMNGYKDYNNSNDIIQDFYIDILNIKDIDRFVLNGEPNMGFVYIKIRNMIINKKAKKKKIEYEIIDNLNEDVIEEEDYSDGRCLKFVLDEIDKIDDWFDKRIIDLYINKKHSIRSLSEGTGITPHYIQPIIYNFKLKCREQYNQYENQYKNQNTI